MISGTVDNANAVFDPGILDRSVHAALQLATTRI